MSMEAGWYSSLLDLNVKQWFVGSIPIIGKQKKEMRSLTMTKTELVSAICQQTGATQRVVGAILAAEQEEIKAVLKRGENVVLPGFGSFTVKQRNERQGRNPATNETITIPARKVVAFKAGKILSESIR